MKRKIEYQLTVGSHWPSDRGEPILGAFELPVGGTMINKVVEFEQKTDNPMQEADVELQRQMAGKTYHIWYWSWFHENK